METGCCLKMVCSENQEDWSEFLLWAEYAENYQSLTVRITSVGKMHVQFKQIRFNEVRQRYTINIHKLLSRAGKIQTVETQIVQV